MKNLAALEKYRDFSDAVTEWMGDVDFRSNGVFHVPCAGSPFKLKIIASSGHGWDHVSVSLPNRCPWWAEMCLVKDLFWTPEDCVMQLHVPKVDYINFHPYCLHLWKPHDAVIPQPPSILVGPKT